MIKAVSERPHDILAAEEFVVPAADPALKHTELPADPTGIAAPHDVLAAEEFPLPAPPESPAQAGPPQAGA